MLIYFVLESAVMESLLLAKSAILPVVAVQHNANLLELIQCVVPLVVTVILKKFALEIREHALLM